MFCLYAHGYRSAYRIMFYLPRRVGLDMQVKRIGSNLVAHTHENWRFIQLHDTRPLSGSPDAPHAHADDHEPYNESNRAHRFPEW
jgi:hypothetical protein